MIILGSPFLIGSSAKMIDVISSLGLTSGLKLCLDAGDENSYSSGQKWLDTSGGGYDFFLGASSSSEATDPTFTGTPGGQSSSEYWSFDGGDYFTYDTSNETWMNNLHKNNAKYTFATWVYVASLGTAQPVFGNGIDVGERGVIWLISASGKNELAVGNGSGNVYVGSTTATVTSGQWTFLAIALDETVGTAIFRIGTTTDSQSASYSSPSSSDTSVIYQIGRGQSSTVDRLIRSGGRLAALSIWESLALSSTQLDDLYNATKGKFGL